jgi:hypothetical protein
MEKIVTRAICAGISKFDGSAMNELLSIRNELCTPERNSRTRVAMLYTSRWFMLWVEGDDPAVEKVLGIAAADRRVAHQKLLHRSRGPAQLPDRVTVSMTQSPLRPTQYVRIVAQLTEHGPYLEPLQIFRAMASPCVIAPEGDVRTRPTRHIALVSAEDNGPIDQLRKLGERFRTPVVYRRFGGPKRHTADVGISYLDLPLAGAIGRIHLLPRRALEQAFVRQALRHLEGMALLLGSSAGAAVSAASAVADCLQGCTPQPAVYMSSAVDEGARACARLLTERGVGRISQFEPQSHGLDIEALLPLVGWSTRGNSVGAAPGPTPAARGPLHGWAGSRPVPTI